MVIRKIYKWRNFVFYFMAVLAVFIISCTHDFDEMNLQRENSSSPFKVDEAQTLLENNAHVISFLNTLSACSHTHEDSIKTKSLPSNTLDNYHKILSSLTSSMVIEWKKAIERCTPYGYTVEVPISFTKHVKSSTFYGKGHKLYNIQKNDIRMVLLIEKHKTTDSVRFTMITTIAEENVSDKKMDAYQFYTSDKREFKGYQIFSTLEGDFLIAYRYNKGSKRRVHISRYLNKIGDDGEDIDYRGIRFMLPQSYFSTKGGNNNLTGEDELCQICFVGKLENGYCVECGSGQLDDVYITGGACAFCGYVDCRCCMYCFQYPCACHDDDDDHDPFDDFICMFCGKYFCPGDCDLYGEGDGKDGGEGHLNDLDTTAYYSFNIIQPKHGTINLISISNPAVNNKYPEGTIITLSVITNADYLVPVWKISGWGDSIDFTFSFTLKYNCNVSVELLPFDASLKNIKDTALLRKLTNSLNELKQNCVGNYIYNSVATASFYGHPLSYTIGTPKNKEGGLAEYHWGKGEVVFPTLENISSGTIREELIHACQDLYQGDNRYIIKESRLNVEYEAKLIIELMQEFHIFSKNNNHCYDRELENINKKNKTSTGENLSTWLRNVLLNNVEKIEETEGYSFFLEKYKLTTKNYDGLSVSNKYTPYTLNRILSHFKDTTSCLKTKLEKLK